jgi:flagellar protein FlaJ
MIVFVMLPAISMVILYALDKTVVSSLVGSRDLLVKGIMYSLAAIGAFVALTLAGVIQAVISPTYAFPAFLIAASALPAYRSLKTEKNMKAMESELAGYLRDVAEARKAGLSPEKCIIYASERLRDKTFQGIVKAFSNQLEWGVPLRKIYANLSRTIKSWAALVHFRILIEAIESGGGYTTSLEILAQSSESAYTTEREKKSLLKPYFMIAFMVTALMSITTLMVAQTFLDIGNGLLPSGQASATTSASQGLSSIQLFSIGMTAQAWTTGFLMGKISSGSFATGFKYGIMLVAITAVVTVATQQFHLSPSILMKAGSPGQ